MSIKSKIVGVLRSMFGIRPSPPVAGGPGAAAQLRIPGTTAFATTNIGITSTITDTTGIGADNGGIFHYVAALNDVIRFGDTDIRFVNTYQVAWASGAPGATAADVGIERLAAGVMGTTDGSTGTGWLQNEAGEKRRTATQTVTNSSTFENDNTLSVSVKAGRRYRFRLLYIFTTVNTSGVKVDFNGGDATMTAINGKITLKSSADAVLNSSQITALTSAAALTATGTLAYVEAEGSLEVNAAGTFITRFAQNAETGAAESVIAQIGSFLSLEDVP